jgi:hypothetical protein
MAGVAEDGRGRDFLMAKLTAAERAELEARLAADDQDDEDDFEIEIRDGDKSARIPYRKGRAYLQAHFGIDLDPEPAEDAPDEPGKPAKGLKAVPADGDRVKRFGRTVG